MKISIFIFGSLASIFHLFFFSLESLLWMTPSVRKAFQLSVEHAKINQLMAFNQGFYNLFLALGAVAGMVMIYQENTTSGSLLLFYSCLCMFGASLVLVFSSPKAWQGAVAQGIFPFICILLLVLQKYLPAL